MKDCDKLIVVFYLGVNDMGNVDICSLLDEASHVYGDRFDESVKTFFIPVKGTSHSRIEVLNPHYISRNQFKKTSSEIKNTCKQAQRALKKDNISNFFNFKF
jgi:hypothetical protein